MIFTSLTFWIFFVLTFAVYWLIPRPRGQNTFLLLASYVFYGWFTPWYAVLLRVLAFFKYYNFFNTQVAETLAGAGLRADWLFINIFLPAGLSFYTLKKLAYMIDISRGLLEP